MQSVSKTTFSHEFRIVTCAHCGAPIQGDLAGGNITCQYCQANNQVRPRNDASDRAAATAAPRMAEGARFSKLREQDGKPILPPPNLLHLLVGGGIPAQKLPEAQHAWRAAVTELSSAAAGGFPGGNFAANERLYFLTVMIASAYAGDQSKNLQMRAMLETACDHITDASYRQDLHGQLCRYAANEADLEGAEGWLDLLCPHSDDLRADTAFRYSYAYVASSRGDFAAALQALGQHPNDVPIIDSADFMCDLLRANAHERSGNLPLAQQQVMQIASRPSGKQAIPQCIAAHPSLDMCPQARGAVHQAPAPGVQAAAGGGGSILGALTFLLIPIGFLVAAVLVPSDAKTDDGFSLTWFFVFMAAAFAIGPIIMVVIAMAGKKNRAHFAEHGIDGQGKILSVSQTGMMVNDEPQVALQLEVYAGDIPVYQVTVKKVIPPVQLAQLQPGATIQLKVDRSNPQNVLL